MAGGAHEMDVQSAGRTRGRASTAGPGRDAGAGGVGDTQRARGSGRLSSSRAVGAAGARLPDTEKVTGSNPVRPTRKVPTRGFAVGILSYPRLLRQCFSGLIRGRTLIAWPTGK